MQDLKNTIITEDCIEVMKSIPDECIDMTFADPPFNLNKQYNTYKDSKDEEVTLTQFTLRRVVTKRK